MKTAKINNYGIQIFETYNGTELYISNPEGEMIYKHKVSGDAMEIAKQIISTL